MPETPAPAKPSPLVQWIVWGLLLVVMGVILDAFLKENAAQPSAPALPVYAQLTDFTLTNQFGRAITLSDLRGKVSVVDIIFTRCPGPCAEMTRRLSVLQNSLPAAADVQIVSLTTDPEFDTPEILQQYATRFGAQTNRWQFLTGTKAQMRAVAVDNFKLVLLDKKIPEQTAPNDLFIHSTVFVIVDRQGRVRATVESDQADHPQRVQNVVNQLLREK